MMKKNKNELNISIDRVRTGLVHVNTSRKPPIVFDDYPWWPYTGKRWLTPPLHVVYIYIYPGTKYLSIYIHIQQAYACHQHV